MTEYRKRTKELTIRLTDQELDSIRSVALARGTSMSNLARDMLLSLGAEVRKTKSSKQNNKANDLDREFLAELGKIGGNINQLARFANTHKSRVDALALLSQLASIEKQLVSLIDDN
jgi:cysteine synthase